jgi:D-lactate dehydrogenase (cytochrome)
MLSHVIRCLQNTKASTKGLKELGVFSSIVGHLGDGNFHEAIMYHKSDPVESAAVEKHVKNMINLALEMDGTSTVSAISTILPSFPS